MSAIVRLVHRLVPWLHRWEPCTLVDLNGIFHGRRCRCGALDADAWEWVAPVGAAISSRIPRGFAP
ncbi:MAG TPA: hypothetical protein VK504_02170 [Vicinamibacterales bacterium]|jgi:hypothetical protein|nr:hypothetical protein [Vicinamibacterales bacterium]